MSEELARQVAALGISDPAVLLAMAETPRERFVPGDLRKEADWNRPLPIGFGQTISQPFIVAYMTEKLGLKGVEKVLEVGTGSGYQTAILARLAAEVYSVERVEPLADRARETLLNDLGLKNVHLRVGDGRLGWPEAAPFDRVIVTAAALEVPQALLDQLAVGGQLLIPVEDRWENQVLRVIERGAAAGEIIARDLIGVRFVPLL